MELSHEVAVARDLLVLAWFEAEPSIISEDSWSSRPRSAAYWILSMFHAPYLIRSRKVGLGGQVIASDPSGRPHRNVPGQWDRHARNTIEKVVEFFLGVLLGWHLVHPVGVDALFGYGRGTACLNAPVTQQIESLEFLGQQDRIFGVHWDNPGTQAHSAGVLGRCRKER